MPMTKMQAVLARCALVVAVLSAAFAGSHGGAQGTPFDPSAATWNLEPVVEGLNQPLHMVDANDGNGRFFVVLKGGQVLILKDGEVQETPFLDISGQVSTGSEQGLLSMALHPDFAENGTFFIDYTDVDGHSNIERWQVSADDPDVADPESAETILFQEQPYANHNGGLVLFGPDGFLYIGFGDGGSQGDPDGNGQNLGVLLGKILRIDVDNAEGDMPYAFPSDNPYLDRDDARSEVWLHGLRNPWRFSFDRETGDLVIADVGGGLYEEVTVAPAGESGLNLGWPVTEGPECRNEGECDQSGITQPIFAYQHDFGCSITGGYVYRGTAIESLYGGYLVGDYCSGLVWVVDPATGAASDPVETGLSISSFAEDASGELYIVDLNGGIYRVVP
jgi:glucose/arabinose dehydrogenase